MKKLILSTAAIAITSISISTTASAALASDAVLNFDAGISGGGYYATVVSGSYFGMDFNGDGSITSEEKIAISQNEGLVLGSSQVSSGSHTGAPGCISDGITCTAGDNGSVTPTVDNPWALLGNTGMHGSSSPTFVTVTGANTADIDFSGWFMTWNGINISLGGDLASVVCAVDCAIGDTYTLDYSVIIPQPSDFSGAPYTLHLEGTVSAVPVPAAVWLFASGLIGLVSIASRRRR